jgi:hypothetical protein
MNWKEAFVAYFNVLSQNLPEGTIKNTTKILVFQIEIRTLEVEVLTSREHLLVNELGDELF